MPEFKKIEVNVPNPAEPGYCKGYLTEDGQTARTAYGLTPAVDEWGNPLPETILYDSNGNPILGSEAKLPR